MRPTDPTRKPEKIVSFLSKDQLRLYQLIWQKFVSSQMSNEVASYTTIDVSASNKIFRATERKVKFEGFTLIFDKSGEKEKHNALFAKLKEGLELKPKKFEPKQHFTKAPPRYSDAMMVKVLEESGVGRPSTYAPTIQTLLKRYYANRVGRNLKPTELGVLVNRIMNQHFPRLVDVNFTARMEGSWIWWPALI